MAVVFQPTDHNPAVVVRTDGVRIYLHQVFVERGHRVSSVANIGTQTAVGGDINLSGLTIHCDVVDVVVNQRGVVFREMGDGLYPIGTHQIHAHATRADPLAVATVNRDALHRNLVQKVVGKVRPVVAGHFHLCQRGVAAC